jgi:hypothetical protein
MLLETAIRSEVGADLVALLVHRDASKRQRIRVSKARAIIVTGDPYHFSRQKTFASLKLQEGPGDIADAPPEFPRQEAKMDGRRRLANASKGGRSTGTTTCDHKWMPHFNGGVWYTIVVQVTCSSV